MENRSRLKKSMEKIGSWLKSAAGIVSICLLIVSVILLVLACSPWGNLTERAASNVNNILFGLGTNLIGIIITVSFVQFFLDRQNTNTERKYEQEKILRFDRIMQIHIQHYTMYFNTITTPMDQRSTVSTTELKHEFSFSDMRDLYLQSLFLRNKSYEPAIVAFYDAELELRKYCAEFSSQIDFKYNQKLLSLLTQFVEVSLAFDTRSAVLGNSSLKLGDKKLTDFVRELMEDFSHDWVSEIHSANGSGNMIAPYVTLFDMLNIEKELISQYITSISDLKSDISN